MTDLVLIARRRTQVDSRNHYPGCERDHTECLIQRMADEIERRDEWRDGVLAEIERLHAERDSTWNAALDAAEKACRTEYAACWQASAMQSAAAVKRCMNAILAMKKENGNV